MAMKTHPLIAIHLFFDMMVGDFPNLDYFPIGGPKTELIDLTLVC
jgi:hypothetical protein